MADEVTEIKVEETTAEPVAKVEPAPEAIAEEVPVDTEVVKDVKLVKGDVVFELTDPVQISAFINQGYEVKG
ncbi:Uncharacterised protein [Streptococcus pneumoniae]|nr:Uncharacterised protein [Streptococcus pneumoniae]